MRVRAQDQEGTGSSADQVETPQQQLNRKASSIFTFSSPGFVLALAVPSLTLTPLGRWLTILFIYLKQVLYLKKP